MLPSPRFIEGGAETRSRRSGHGQDGDGRVRPRAQLQSVTSRYITVPGCLARDSGRVNKVLLPIPSDHPPCLAPSPRRAIAAQHPHQNPEAATEPGLASALCGASRIPNRPRQILLRFCKLQMDSTENTMKASEGSPRESLCWQAWSHHGGSQELCPEHHVQLPHTATQTARGSSLPHSHNTPHSSFPGAAKIRKAAALGVSTAGRELKKKSMFIGG